MMSAAMIALGLACNGPASPQSRAAALQELAAAQMQFDANDLHRAIKSCGEAIGHDPDLADAYALRAMAMNDYIVACRHSGKRDVEYSQGQVTTDIDRALKLDPNCGLAHAVTGNVFFMQGKTAEAVKEYSKAIPHLKDPTNAQLLRADLAFMMGDYATAVADMTAVIERQPPNAGFYEDRALYRRATGDFQGSIEDTAQAERLRGAATATAPRPGPGNSEAAKNGRSAADQQPVAEPALDAEQ